MWRVRSNVALCSGASRGSLREGPRWGRLSKAPRSLGLLWAKHCIDLIFVFSFFPSARPPPLLQRSGPLRGNIASRAHFEHAQGVKQKNGSAYLGFCGAGCIATNQKKRKADPSKQRNPGETLQRRVTCPRKQAKPNARRAWEEHCIDLLASGLVDARSETSQRNCSEVAELGPTLGRTHANFGRSQSGVGPIWVVGSGARFARNPAKGGLALSPSR